ncbi:P-loop containing nucleoside triphosphate hydrolase protein [Ampelomyces quisqualis]|uniref:RNA helicase n=1 Tax=Ampelomyces quisqualis TaxID=50730 RepID=A0A6A5QDQ9_AMPQU|nr:P-loop containing nucleoside triphosphate hydrolase protein [Ampelomyces quisqualis]
MDDFEHLEVLGLVEKIVCELNSHLGLLDRTLAEFIIAQRVESITFEAFKKKITETGGDAFSSSLLESIDHFVRTMHPAMKAMKAKPDATHHEQVPMAKGAQTFPGLDLSDHSPIPDSIEDTLKSLEALVPSNPTHTHQSQRKRQKRTRSRSRSTETGHRQLSNRTVKGHVNKIHNEWQPLRQRRARRGSNSDNELQAKETRSRRSPLMADKSPVLYKIYEGYIASIKDFGIFVELYGVEGRAHGLVHISQIADQRLEHPSDCVERGQSVKVKVISVDGPGVGLSMKQADQKTGRDLTDQMRVGSGANMQALGGSKNGYSNSDVQVSHTGKRARKRLTTPERWEIRQLIASGVVNAAEYPDEEDDMELGVHGERLEEDVDIEVRNEEPPFLAGQTKQSLELSPIRVVKAPEGSLNRAAMSGTALAKERKELQQEGAEKDTGQATTNISAQWNDPMADPGKQNFASIGQRTAQASTTTSGGTPEWKTAVKPKDQSYGKRVNLPMKQQRESLPVFVLRDQLIESVRKNQILIVVGETGSGKTTQTTQYLAEAGFANNGIIGCTQPRRVAAISVAKRVAEEVGCVLGEEVGYSIRFEDRTSSATKIKYMTDGMLQREILQDPELKKYSVIMLDEAHERTIATDVLFVLLKKALKKRPDLKVIVTSATLNADKFSLYFNKAPIFTIPGRTYPVEVLYSREPESDYLEAALVTVLQIHLTEPAGDVLLFLTGQEEIDTSCEILYERMKVLGPSVPELLILPVYSALPTEMQSRIFEPAPHRKVVIATNIAETSITIDNIYYVVDPGFVKQKAYDPKLGMDSLIAMGINDLLNFDFMDPPPVNATLTALEELYALSALDDEGLLTSLGRKMTNFPMDPPLARVVLAAVELGCSDEMLSIVAMLNVLNVFYRPKDKQAQADQKKAKFHDSHGDHLTLLNVYTSWKQNGYSSAWCFENFIQVRSMKQAKNVREQLVNIMDRFHYPIISSIRETENVRRALCAGFFRNTARRDASAGTGSYKTVIENTPVFLHPSSALFGKSTEWVVYHELVLTSREYMHWCTSIDPKWLVEEVPTCFKMTGINGTMSKRRKQERIQPLHNKFAGEDDWRLSAQRRGGRGGGGTWG